jgi:hypothetical protein
LKALPRCPSKKVASLPSHLTFIPFIKNYLLFKDLFLHVCAHVQERKNRQLVEVQFCEIS